MSLLKKIGLGKVKSNSAEGSAKDTPLDLKAPLSKQAREKRAHRRFPLGLPSVIYIDFGGRTLVPISDVSYGGFVAELDQVPEKAKSQEGMPAMVFCFSESAPVVVGHVYSKGKTAAFRFHHHNSPESLLFLRGPLEALRFGSTLKAAPGDSTGAQQMSRGWTRFQGDSQTDLKIFAPGEELQEALMSFRFGDALCEVSYKNGIVHARRSAFGSSTAGASALGSAAALGAGGASGASGMGLDHSALQKAICILAGVTDKSVLRQTDQLFRLLYDFSASQGEFHPSQVS